MKTAFLGLGSLVLAGADLSYIDDFYSSYDMKFNIDPVHKIDTCAFYGDCDESVARDFDTDLFSNILEPIDSVRSLFNEVNLPTVYSSLTDNQHILEQVIRTFVVVSCIVFYISVSPYGARGFGPPKFKKDQISAML